VRRRLVALALGIVVAIGLWVALTATGSPPLRRAPSFTLPRLDGGGTVGLPLTGLRAHHPVVLTFFASWCGPCHRELPMVAGVARAEQARGGTVEFLGIDGNDGTAAGLAFARASGVSFPVGADTASAVAPRFTLVGYPGTVFIDARDRVVDTVHGPVTRAVLDSWLARLEKSSPGP
jgi:thiol-disulfide isomerase/thioredoxin